MLETFEPDQSLPENKADWEAIRLGRIEPASGIEAASVAIDPEKWTEMQRAVQSGWKPTWRDRIIKRHSDTASDDPDCQ